MREFNDWVLQMRESIGQVVGKACGSPAIPPNVAERYVAVLRWMVQKGCVLYQHDPYIKRNRLYEYVGQLLQAGHCVCGWEGEFPEGNLVVY